MKLFDFIKPNVRKMKDKKDIKGLIKALEHKDRNIRAEVAKLLWWNSDRRAITPLTQVLTDPAPEVREVTHQALAELNKVM